jgi:hypothetical protein
MLNKILAAFAAVAVVLGLSKMRSRADRKAGRDEAERDAMKEQLSNAKKASTARDSVRTDSIEFERLRDKYRRD